MKLRTRLLLLLIIIVIQLLYFPINRSVNGGRTLFTSLDRHIPLLPIWTVPYLLSLPLWLASFIWATSKMETYLFIAFFVATTTVMLASYVVYLFYPTYVERPIVPDSGWAVALVRFIYNNDRSYNAFPSGHTYTTMLIFLFWWRWYSRLRVLWIFILLMILLSTLFTRQHYILDLAGGVLLSILGFAIGLLSARRMSIRRDITPK